MSKPEGIVEKVQSGYDFDVPCIELGALIVDDEPLADARVRVPMAMMNRHGLVAGATGTGKTKTLQVMAEQASMMGVPCFAADIKGDLSGLASPGASDEKIEQRAATIGQAWEPTGFPVELLRLGDEGVGVPVRATVTSFGPTLMSKVLQLNETQESSLGLVFHYADKAGLPLVDLQDLRQVIQHLTSDEGKEDLKELGGLAKATAGVILRELINFAATGADTFFGEPEFDVNDLMRTAPDGRGIITLLELPSVQDRPVLFSTFLMWLLAELFETMPEVGDLDKPKLLFFFDEAHLLFKNASKDFLSSLIQTTRLIRSKGVGVFYVTQTPKDVHEDVLAQLGSRVQHQLRAFTPNDAEALKATVKTYPHTDYDLEDLLQSLGIGEAVVTVMSEKGAPTPVAHTMIPAPQSLMDPSADDVLNRIVDESPLEPKYGERLERDSAYEMLTGKIESGPGEGMASAGTATPYGAPADSAQPAAPPTPEPATAPSTPQPAPTSGGMTDLERLEAEILGTGTAPTSSSRSKRKTTPKVPKARSAPKGSMFDNLLKTAAETLTKEISRGVFGTLRRR